MKIALIAPDETFQTKNLAEQAAQMGHTLERLSLAPIAISDKQNDQTIKNLSDFDVVYFRNGADMVTKMILGEMIANSGKKFINSGYYINPLLADKVYQNYTAAINGINVPKTITVKDIDDSTFDNLVKQLSLPFIAKPSRGSKGKGVSLIKSKEDFNTKILEGSESSVTTIYQQFIKNDGDYRVIIVGGKAIGTFKRIPPENDFRANISQGGHGEIVEDEELKSRMFLIAEKMAKVLHLEVAGIDLIKDEAGELYLIETNSIPQWEGFTTTTGINVAEKIIKFFEGN